jgi:hypothetical protein
MITISFLSQRGGGGGGSSDFSASIISEDQRGSPAQQEDALSAEIARKPVESEDGVSWEITRDNQEVKVAQQKTNNANQNTQPAATTEDSSEAERIAKLETELNETKKQLADQKRQDPDDLDNDKLPNEWEEANGLNPENATDAGLDFDNDKLPNYLEYLLRTDPRSNDSDQDGVRDFDEVINRQNPAAKEQELSDKQWQILSQDTDNDGLKDWEEIILKTDRREADSDQNGVNDPSQIRAEYLYWRN